MGDQVRSVAHEMLARSLSRSRGFADGTLPIPDDEFADDPYGFALGYLMATVEVYLDHLDAQ